MSYLYNLSALTPLDVYLDESGDTHSVYWLPAPKVWRLRYHIDATEDYFERKQFVSKVRVCLFVDEESGLPEAIVIPFGPNGQEYLTSSVIYRGVISYVGVLDRMGFEPLLHLH